MGEYAEHRGERIKIGTCEDMYYLRFDQRERVRALAGNVDPVKDAAALRFRFPWPDEDRIQPGGAFEVFDRGLTVYGFTVPADSGIEHYSVQFRAEREGYLISLPCPESSAYTDYTGIGGGRRMLTAAAPRGVEQTGGSAVLVGRNGFIGAVQLTQQRFRPGIGLCPVLRCACGAAWREEEPSRIEELAMCIRAEGDRRQAEDDRCRVARGNIAGEAEAPSTYTRDWYHAIADRVLDGVPALKRERLAVLADAAEAVRRVDAQHEADEAPIDDETGQRMY